MLVLRRYENGSQGSASFGQRLATKPVTRASTNTITTPATYFSAQVADITDSSGGGGGGGGDGGEQFDGFGTPDAGDVNSYRRPKAGKPNPKGKARPERKASFKDFLAARRAQEATEEATLTGSGGGGGGGGAVGQGGIHSEDDSDSDREDYEMPDAVNVAKLSSDPLPPPPLMPKPAPALHSNTPASADAPEAFGGFDSSSNDDDDLYVLCVGVCVGASRATWRL